MIEIDQIGSITQETEFSRMAELLYDVQNYISKFIFNSTSNSNQNARNYSSK